jgi:hypothetical protein
MHRGSCLCESIQYEIESDLRAVVNCHCNDQPGRRDVEGGRRTTPGRHINTESKCAWFQITDALPQFASMPGPAELRALISDPAEAPRAGG